MTTKTLDGILRELGLGLVDILCKEDIKHITQAKSEIVGLLPKEKTSASNWKDKNDAQIAYKYGWNAYRKQVLKNFGIKE